MPRLAVVDDIPTRTSGKVDRDALPWPLAGADPADAGLHGTAAVIAEVWQKVIGAAPDGPDADFFDLGGGSLTAAQVVTLLRSEHAESTVADLYEHSTVGALTAFLDSLEPSLLAEQSRKVLPIPRKTQARPGRRRPAAAGAGRAALAGRHADLLPGGPRPPRRRLAAGGLVVGAGAAAAALHHPAGADAARGQGSCRRSARGCARASTPAAARSTCGSGWPSGSRTSLGATRLAGAPYMTWYARLLGAKVAKGADLHSLPPVTGLLTVGKGASVEPEVDLTGYWIDGDTLHVGGIRVGRRARVGTRSMLAPDAVIGDDAEVAPGSAVFGEVPTGEFWSGAPATRARLRRPRPVGGAARGHAAHAAHLGRPVRRRGGRARPAPRPRDPARARAGPAARRPRCHRRPGRRGPCAAAVGRAGRAGRRGGPRGAGAARRTTARARGRGRRAPAAEPAGAVRVGHHPGPRRGPDLAVPALLLAG
ncbi:phosphopantetheine-binding protein [Nocardioides convexus]|uniref:phosphopantetheine-binding protein n=1 Tax=Nocardioides convexus TaxID=2712224 RepID=UPI002418622B|nr:phosphopantetheine-binding protein [Nocardioides convexus]